jgi:hypothetical protein
MVAQDVHNPIGSAESYGRAQKELALMDDASLSDTVSF